MRNMAGLVQLEAKVFAGDRFNLSLTLLLVVLLLYGLWNGRTWVANEQHTIDNARRAQRIATERGKQAASNIVARKTAAESIFYDPTSPGVVAGMFFGGHYAILPPAALSPLAIGQSDLRPSYIKVALQPEQDVLSVSEIENPETLLTGHFDFSFVCVYVLPLFLLAISYQILSEDLETGNLSLLLTQNVSLLMLLTARNVVRLSVAIACTGTCLLLAIISAGTELANPAVWWNALLLWAAIAVYSAFWLAVSSAINLSGRKSSFTAIALVACWLGFALIVPSLVNLYANRLYPPPSRITQIQESRRAADAAAARGAQTLQNFLNDHPDLAPQNANAGMTDFYASTLAVRTEAQNAVAPTLRRFAIEQSQRDRFLRRFRFLSPAILMRIALEDAAGSGDARYEQFMQQVRGYYKQWVDFFSWRIIQQKRFGPSDYDIIPAFHYVPESGSAVAIGELSAIAGIAVPGAIVAVIVGLLGVRFKPIQRF